MRAAYYIVFLDSISFLPFALRKLPEGFGLTVAKSLYPHYFNTRDNLDSVEKIVVIAHNAKASDLHFILNRAILLKRQVELIMNGMKIMCMRAC